MTEIDLTEYFLTAVITYGSPMFGLALLLGALGTPLPSTLLVLAAGAFVRQGVINVYTTFPMGLLGAVMGDSLSYTLGRFAKGWVEKRFANAPLWLKAQTTFVQRGGMAVYLTRFLLTPLAIPTNLVAGGSGYSFWRFLLYDVIGETTWLLTYGSLGYTFGTQWELISEFAGDFSGLLIGIVALGTGIYFFLKSRAKSKVTADR